MKNKTDALDEAIITLEKKHTHELVLLKEQLHSTYESLKPINLIKNLFSEASSSSEIKGDIAGIVTGFISKKLLIGSSKSPIRELMGNIIQFITKQVVSKYGGNIKILGENLLHRYFKQAKQSE